MAIHPDALTVIRVHDTFTTFDESAFKLALILDTPTDTLAHFRLPFLRFSKESLIGLISATDPCLKRSLRIYGPDGQLDQELCRVDKKGQIILPGDHLEFLPDDPMWYHYGGPIILPDQITIAEQLSGTKMYHRSDMTYLADINSLKAKLTRLKALYYQVSNSLSCTSYDSCTNMSMVYRKVRAVLRQLEAATSDIPSQINLFE